jgi:hypothetical protein
MLIYPDPRGILSYGIISKELTFNLSFENFSFLLTTFANLVKYLKLQDSKAIKHLKTTINKVERDLENLSSCPDRKIPVGVIWASRQ